MAYPSSVFLRLAPGPGPRPPVLCGALSASPRRKCWNLMRFRHLSLSCTPVRPLRREEEEGKKGEGKRSVGGLDVLERARWSAGGNSAGRPRAGAGERRGIATRVHGRRRAGRSVDEARPYARARSTHRPPPRGQFTASRETGTRLNRGLTNQRLRHGRLRQARLSRLRVVSAARRGGSREQAEDSLQNFKVGIVSHLLPRPDAVLLHGVAERLLLLIVPVPSERHFEVSRLYCTRLRRRTRASVAGNDARDVRGLSSGSTVEATVSASRPDRQWAFPPFGRRTPRVFNCRTRAARKGLGSISSIDFHRRIIGVSTLANWSEDHLDCH